MIIDEIVTERLRLRPLTLDDVPALYNGLFADPEVTWDGAVYTMAETASSVESKQRHLEEYGFGMLAVTDQDSGEVIGYAGLQHLEGGPEVELGYYLRRSAWGRGLGTEIARALIQTAFGELHLGRVVAVVRPENAASKRVLLKAGLRSAGYGRHYDEDVEVWVAEVPNR